MIIKIGKAKDNDFIANDPHVSRHHARLIREDGGNLFRTSKAITLSHKTSKTLQKPIKTKLLYK